MRTSLQNCLAIILLLLCHGIHRPVAAAENPVLAGRWPGYERGPVWDLDIKGNYAFVAATYAGLQIMDVSDPLAPVRVGGYDVTGMEARAVSVAGDYACVAYGSAGMLILDVRNPARIGRGRSILKKSFRDFFEMLPCPHD